MDWIAQNGMEQFERGKDVQAELTKRLYENLWLELDKKEENC